MKALCVYDVVRNGVIFRSFSNLSKAVEYVNLARELCPDDQFLIRSADLFEDDSEEVPDHA